MIWTVIIVVVGYIIINFFIKLDKDNSDLYGQSLDEKFFVIANMLNKSAYNSKGKITKIDKRRFSIYADGSNQYILFDYSTGHLTITWRYKCLHKEVKFDKQFNDVRNISLFEQEKIGNIMINEMSVVIDNHKKSVYNQ